MPASAAFSGYGTTFEIGNASGGTSSTYTTVGEVKKLDISNDKVDLEDVTHMQSPDARHEYITTLIDDGEISFDANFIPDDAGQVEMKTARDARSKRDFRITLPNSLGVYTADGFVVGFSRPLAHDKAATVSGKVKITGALDLA